MVVSEHLTKSNKILDMDQKCSNNMRGKILLEMRGEKNRWQQYVDYIQDTTCQFTGKSSHCIVETTETI